MSNNPLEPPHACPDIDSAIEIMENIRSTCENLRTYGNFWENEAEELQDRVNSLEDQLEDYKNQLDSAVEEIKQTQGEILWSKKK